MVKDNNNNHNNNLYHLKKILRRILHRARPHRVVPVYKPPKILVQVVRGMVGVVLLIVLLVVLLSVLLVVNRHHHPQSLRSRK
jgi:hypothetical protein